MREWLTWLAENVLPWIAGVCHWVVGTFRPWLSATFAHHWWIIGILTVLVAVLLLSRVTIPAWLRDSAPGRTLRDFQPNSRKVMKWSLVTGLSTLCVGVWADITKPAWFSALSYIPNIWAALTGFLIGAPFALVVLATFTVQREETSNRKAVERLSANAWKAFVDAVMSLCSDERIAAVTSRSQELNDAQTRTFRAMNFFVCTVRGTWMYRALMLGDSDSDVISPNPAVHLEEVKDSLPEFRAALDAVIPALGLSDEVELIWSSVRGAWAVLDQYVRIQLLESSIDWFDPIEDAKMRLDMGREENPLKPLIDKIGGEFAIWTDTSSNVTGDYEYALNITMVEDEVKREFVFNNEESFGYTSNYFLSYAEAAAQFLQDLRNRVEEIDQAGWPVRLDSS